MNKRVLFILLIFGLCSLPVSAKTLTKVAAVVNDDIITSYQLDQALKEALANIPDQNRLTSAQFDQLKEKTLHKLIGDKLVDQRIKELDLQVSESELSAAIDDVRRKNNLTEEALQQALAAQGMTMASYRQKITKELLRYKLMGREVNHKVLVTSGEVRDYFREHIDDYRVQPKVHVKEIAYPIPAGASQQDLEKLQKQAELTRQLLLDGEDFDKVVAGQADIASGLDMGEVVEKDLAEPLQKILAGLTAGQISEPIQLNGKLHLFVIADRNPGDSHLFDRVKGKIEDTLRQQKAEARYQEWEQEIYDKAHIDIRI